MGNHGSEYGQNMIGFITDFISKSIVEHYGEILEDQMGTTETLTDSEELLMILGILVEIADEETLMNLGKQLFQR